MAGQANLVKNKIKSISSRLSIPWFLSVLSVLIVEGWRNYFQPIQNNQTGMAVLILCECLAFGFMSFTTARFYSSRTANYHKAYRLAFLSIGCLTLAATILTILKHGDVKNIWLLIPYLAACFAGCIIASNIHRGWWENNAPPSPLMKAEVRNWHEANMGVSIKTPFYKRLLDIILSIFSILLSAPIWLLLIFVIWWEDPGPVFFVKNAVGKGGVNFKQLKFRTMILDAEKETGPITGYENDERVFTSSKIIRKTALDELPQLINILVGDMSYVGPRPQRTVLVHGYLQKWPEYAARHRLRPGLAGLAQVADTSFISPSEKLAWDLIYIEKLGFGMDLRIMLVAFLLVFILRWKKNINLEATTRKLLGVEKPGVN